MTAERSQAGVFPRMVVVNSGYPCNALCPHCPYTPGNSAIRSEPRARQTPFMPREVLRAIADEVGRHGAILRISGAGEPLMHPELLEGIEYACAAGCDVGLITNGSLLDEPAARRLIDCGTGMIEFSVDAADAADYDVVRKGLRFEVTLENVRRTVALRDAVRAPTRIIASVVKQKRVAGRIDAIVAFWQPIVDVVQVRKFLTWDINDLEGSADLAPYLDPEAVCPFPFDRLLIDTNGEMRFCVYDIKARTNWGRIPQEGIAAVWTGARFEWLREIHRRGDLGQMPICAGCLDRQFRSWDYNYFHLQQRAEQARRARLQD